MHFKNEEQKSLSISEKPELWTLCLRPPLIMWALILQAFLHVSTTAYMKRPTAQWIIHRYEGARGCELFPGSEP